MKDAPRTMTLDVVLAEFTAARTAGDRGVSVTLSLISLNATAIAAVGGIVVSGHGNPAVLVVIPILSSILGIGIVDQVQYSQITDSYIMTVLRPLVVELTGDDRLLGIHDYYSAHRGSTRLLTAVGMGIAFPGVSIGSLVVSGFYLTSIGEWAAWILGVILTALLVRIGAVMAKRQFLRSAARGQAHSAKSGRLGD
jgi:hypothetical protein